MQIYFYDFSEKFSTRRFNIIAVRGVSTYVAWAAAVAAVPGDAPGGNTMQ